jgi:chemotaxis protein methyltransferase CheR
MPSEVANATKLAPARKQEAQDPVFLRIRDLVYQTCGIYHSDEKLYLLVAACQRRMATDTTKAADARGYLDLLTGMTSKEWETRELLNEITIGETCLFRSQPQINALKNVILPELMVERARMGLKKLKIWSAGCSTGEEPHTLSIFLLEEKERLLKDWTYEIPGVDINEEAANLVRFQNAYTASAEVVTTINSLLQTTIDMVIPSVT